jgi:signal transduction histidine kinase
VLLDTSRPQAAAEALHLMTDRITELTGADASWLMVGPEPGTGTYLVTAQTGVGLVDITGTRLTPAQSPLLQAVEAADGLVALDLTGQGYRTPNGVLEWGPCIGIPLRGAAAGDAVLLAARRAGAKAFDDSIGPLVAGFADQAARALDLAARQQQDRQVALYEDRDRIARDLHDHVIQRVFASGLALQAALPRVPDPELRRRIQAVVGQLDDTVRDIRTTIFDLHTAGTVEEESLRRRLLDVVVETAGEALEPTVRMGGAVDTLVTGPLAAEVEAVVREAVSNAARHSGGRHVTVTLDVTDRVVVEVLDDGRGIPATGARSGLRNLEERARRRGGEATVEPVPDGGTLLRWWAPLG